MPFLILFRSSDNCFSLPVPFSECDICNKLVDYIAYINVDLESTDLDDDLDDYFNYGASVITSSYFCNHCGYGFVYSNGKYVLGASNDSKYIVNRYAFTHNMESLIKSDSWIGNNIQDFLAEWKKIDKRIQKNAKTLNINQTTE